MTETQTLPQDDLALLKTLKDAHQRIASELRKVIVGQDEVIHQLMLAIFAQGHVLLEGVPGLAKTLLVSTLAEALEMSFSRVQFTPDLMPSDITGTEVIQEDKATGTRQFKFLPGPIFANVVLADEINRTPPKTQAALLEAMQERQVTIGGTRHKLPAPFFVLATQNPIEQEGTYHLPEAQQDRFMFKVFVKYPSYDEEYRIAETTTGLPAVDIAHVLDAAKMIELQQLVRRLPVPPLAIHYALRLARATRPQENDAPQAIREWVRWGAGPRGVQYLLLGGKANAALDGRSFVTTGDIKAVAHPALRHRLMTSFSAESEGITPDKVVDKLLAIIPETDDGKPIDPQLADAFVKQTP